MKNLFGDRSQKHHHSPSTSSSKSTTQQQTSSSLITSTSTGTSPTTDNSSSNDSLQQQRRCFISHKLHSKQSELSSSATNPSSDSRLTNLERKRRNQSNTTKSAGSKRGGSFSTTKKTTSRRRLIFNEVVQNRYDDPDSNSSQYLSEEENHPSTSISNDSNEILEPSTLSVINKRSKLDKTSITTTSNATPSITAPFSLRKQIQLAVQLSIDELSIDNSLNVESAKSSRSNSPKLSGISHHPHQSAASLITSSVIDSKLSTNISSSEDSESSNFSQQDFSYNSYSEEHSSIYSTATTARKFFRNNKGETELHLAAIRGDFGRLEHLLQQNNNNKKSTRSSSLNESSTSSIDHNHHSYDINIQDFAGWTALHEACNRGHTQAVRVLVNHGANVNASASCGTTPLIDAAANGHQTIVKLLLKHGADPLQANKRGQSALDLAYNDQIEELIRNHLEKKQQKIVSSGASTVKTSPEFQNKKDLLAVIQSFQEDSNDYSLTQNQDSANDKVLKKEDNISKITSSSSKNSKFSGNLENQIFDCLKTPEQKNVQDQGEMSSTSSNSIMSNATSTTTNSTNISSASSSSLSPTTTTTSEALISFATSTNNSSTSNSSISKTVLTNSSSTLSPIALPSTLICSNSTTIVSTIDTTTISSLSSSIDSSNKNLQSLATTSATNNNTTSSIGTSIVVLSNGNNKKSTLGINSKQSANPDSSGASKPIDDSNKIDTITAVITTNQSESLSKESILLQLNSEVTESSNNSSKQGDNKPTSCDISGPGQTKSGQTLSTLSSLTTTSSSSAISENCNTNVTSTNKDNKDSASSSHQLRGRKRRRSGDNNGKKPKDLVSSKTSKKLNLEHLLEGQMDSSANKDSNSSSASNNEDPRSKDDEKTSNDSFNSHSVTTVTSNSNNEQMMMRVPPIRIVLPSSSTGGTNSSGSNGGANPSSGMIVINSGANCLMGNNSGQSDGHGQLGSDPGSNHHQYLNNVHQIHQQQKYPYVVTTLANNTTDQPAIEFSNVENSESSLTSANSAVISSSSSFSGTTTSTTTISTTSNISTTTSSTSTNHRITRSSQRVAQQKHHHDDDGSSVVSIGVGTRKKKNRGQASAHASSTLGNLGSHHSSNSSSSGGNNSFGSSQNNSNVSSSSNYFNSNATSLNSNSSNLPLNNSNGENGESSNLDDGLASTSGGAQNGSNNSDTNVNLYQYVPDCSSYRMFMSIREHVRRRRQTMPIPTMNESKQPPGFQDYLLNRCDYLLRDSSCSSSQQKLPEHLTMAQPPAQLTKGSPLYKLFMEQEQERQQLRLRHQVEQDKLCLVVQQETLRLYNRADMCKKNQTMPLSVCTYLKDEELYNKLELETDHSQDNVIIAQIKTDNPSFLNDGPSALTGCGRIRFNGRVFLSWKSDDDDKWNKVKQEMLNRQRAEAESLASIQRLRWQWKLAELEPPEHGTSGTTASSSSTMMHHSINIDDSLVPTVQIIKDFDLKPV